jgi:hypothetical protein
MPPRSRARAGAEIRKLRAMIQDLEVMKAELCPDEKDRQLAEEMKGYDDFQRKKHELNGLLQATRKSVDRLLELRKKLGRDERDTTTIRLQAENADSLKNALEKFNELRQILAKDEAKKGKKRLSDKELADRRHLVILLGEEIKELSGQNSRVKLNSNEDEAAIAARRERMEKKEKEKKERREKNRKGRKGGKRKGDDLVDEADLVEMVQVTEQEQIFEEKVAENMQAQDEILKAISEGLLELQDLALEANKHLKIEAAMLEQVDEKMDSAIKQFKTANQRLKNILDESGGMSRWCPIMICLIVLLALAGYIFGIL